MNKIKYINILFLLLLLYLTIFIGGINSNHCCLGPINDNLKCSKVYYDNFVLEYHCINDTLLFIYNNENNSPENYNDIPPLSLLNSTMVIPNLHNSIPICGKCDPKLTNSFIGIVLFLAVLIIGILILILFYYNKEINKNSSQYLPIHSPGSGNPSPSSSFLINNNNNNNNYHQNNNSNNNNIIYNPYYNSSTTSPYYLSPNSNHNPSLILYHQSRLLGNIHSINSINNNNNNNNNNPPTNISNKLNKNGETKNI